MLKGEGKGQDKPEYKKKKNLNKNKKNIFLNIKQTLKMSYNGITDNSKTLFETFVR